MTISDSGDLEGSEEGDSEMDIDDSNDGHNYNKNSGTDVSS